MYQQPQHNNQGNAYPPYYNPNYPEGGPPVQTQQTPSQKKYGQQKETLVSSHQALTNNNFSIPGIEIKVLIVNLFFLVHTIFPQGCLMIPNAIERYRGSGPSPRTYVVAPFSLSAILLQCHFPELVRLPSVRGGLPITERYAFAVPVLVEVPSFLTNLALIFVTILFLLTLLKDETSESRSTWGSTYMFLNLCNPGLIIKLFYIIYELVIGTKMDGDTGERAPDLLLYFLWWVIALAWCLVNGLVAKPFSKSSNQGPILPMKGQPGSTYPPGTPSAMNVMGDEQGFN